MNEETKMNDSSKKGTTPIPIIIPGADRMSKKQLERAKHNERMRRYRARKKGIPIVSDKLTHIPKEVKDKEVTYKLDSQEKRLLKRSETMALVKETKNLALATLHKKLALINTDEDELRKINLATLATTFGIMQDKALLLEGKATQNIAVKSKVDVNMSASQAIEALSKMRESQKKDE
jgi:hypothetical protein